jgi:hypothetical protein
MIVARLVRAVFAFIEREWMIVLVCGPHVPSPIGADKVVRVRPHPAFKLML